METIAIKLDAARLTNPDTDIRYTSPNLLAERSGGVIQNDGYDYVGDSNDLVIFLKVSDLPRATDCITGVITSVRVLGNDLSNGAIVAVKRGDTYTVIYPAESQESF
jgi:hypothetical protein